MKLLKVFFILSVAGLMLSGCKTMTRSQKGVAIGAGAGGAVGAGVGKATGNTALGAIIGASVGGIAGGVIGRQMDRQAAELEQIQGAEVTRVGEGINVTFDSGLLFGHDSDALSSDSRSKLNELGATLNKYPDTYILVEGHTDSSGSDSYNKRLSKRRAESVSQFLEQSNIKKSRIRTEWYGENQPKYPNDDPASMAKNRRVEFAIYANEQMIDKAKKDQASN